MITDYEAYKIIEKIKTVNSGDRLNGTAFSYDSKQEKIINNRYKKSLQSIPVSFLSVVRLKGLEPPRH